MSNWCSLAQTASDAANSAKSRYELAQKAELGLLLLAAFAQCLPVSETVLTQKNINWTTVIATSLALFIALLVKAIRLEKIWQESRTVSESAKKMMWFYTMKVSPFDQSDNVADPEFLLSLDRIRSSVKECEGYLVANASNNDPITTWMQNSRSAIWTARKDDYLNERILPQIEWYQSKSMSNSRGDSFTFIISVSLEATALLVAIAILNGSITNTAILGLMTTAAAVALGWGKMQRHKQLSQSYGVTAHLLKNKKQLWRHISSEPDFLAEVEKTEELISRENTNWSVVVN